MVDEFSLADYIAYILAREGMKAGSVLRGEPTLFPGFPRIPQGFTPIRGFAQIHRIRADIRRFAKVCNGIRRFADGFTRIRKSSRMDICRFAQDSQRLVIIPRRESANGDSYVSPGNVYGDASTLFLSYFSQSGISGISHTTVSTLPPLGFR